jgi:hypothetical protein
MQIITGSLFLPKPMKEALLSCYDWEKQEKNSKELNKISFSLLIDKDLVSIEI